MKIKTLLFLLLITIVAQAQTPPKPGATPLPSAVNDTPTKAFEELFNETSFHMWPGGQIASPDNPIVWSPWGKSDGSGWWKPSLCTTNNYLLSGGTTPYLSLNTYSADCNNDWIGTGLGTAVWNSGGAQANGLSTGFLAAPPCYWEFGVFIAPLGASNPANTSGLWPSISLYTDPGNRTKENLELDLVEAYSSEGFIWAHTTWHNYFNNTSDGVGTSINGPGHSGPDLSTGWHVWGIWIDTSLTHWYLDGTEIWNAPTQGVTQLYAVIANATINPINIKQDGQTYTMKVSYVDCWTGSGAAQVTVPNVLTMSQTQASNALSSLGLHPVVKTIYSNTAPQVVSQYPIPGASATVGSNAYIGLSTGSDITKQQNTGTGTGSLSSLAVSFNSAVTAGNSIKVNGPTGVTISSVTDNVGNQYMITTASNQWTAGSITGGASVTVTVNFSAPVSNPSVTILERAPPSSPALPTGVNLPSTYQLRVNQDMTSALYQPGQNCTAIATPTGILGNPPPPFWSTRKDSVSGYPCVDKQPFTSDNGYFAIWTWADGGAQNGGGTLRSTGPDGNGAAYVTPYFEWLVKLPASASVHTHPSLWTRWQATNFVVQNVNNPEIDYLEYANAETSTTSGFFNTNIEIWNGNTVTKPFAVSTTIPAGNGYQGLGSGWHVIGCWVQPANAGNQVVVYLDGVQVQAWTITDSSFQDSTHPLDIKFTNDEDLGFDGTPREFGCKYLRVWAP